MFSSWTAPDSAKEGQRQRQQGEEIQSKGVNAGALVPEETLDPLFLSVSCPIDHRQILRKRDQEAEIQS